MSSYRSQLTGVFVGSHAVAEGFLTKAQLRRRGYRRLVHHVTETQIDVDHERIAALHAAGWRVIRLSAADLRDLPGVIERVRAALAAA